MITSWKAMKAEIDAYQYLSMLIISPLPGPSYSSQWPTDLFGGPLSDRFLDLFLQRNTSDSGPPAAKTSSEAWLLLGGVGHHENIVGVCRSRN